MRVTFAGGVRDGNVEDWPLEQCRPSLRVHDLRAAKVARPDRRYKAGYRLVDGIEIVSGVLVREDNGDGYRYVFQPEVRP